MPVEYFFPTPIYFSFVKDLEPIQKEVGTYLLSVKEHQLANPWGDTVKTTFKYGNYDHTLTHTPLLFREIKNHCKDFLRDLQYENADIEIKESWCNFSQKNSFQHFHLHDEYDLSGVYYYQTTINDGDIVFSNPSLVNKYHKLTSKIQRQINYKPEVGKIIIFPSFLEHAVFHNTTENERISITFNANIVKK